MENVKLLGKLLELQQSVRGLLPDSTGGTGNYRYVSGAKLLGVVRPKMDELGLLLKSEILEVVNTRTDYTVGRDARPKAEMHTCLRMRFTWIDTESGEREVCEWAANGQNDWDKGAGSAMTYGERYFLMKFFHIPTDEDDVDARPGDAQEGDKTAAPTGSAPDSFPSSGVHRLQAGRRNIPRHAVPVDSQERERSVSVRTSVQLIRAAGKYVHDNERRTPARSRDLRYI